MAENVLSREQAIEEFEAYLNKRVYDDDDLISLKEGEAKAYYDTIIKALTKGNLIINSDNTIKQVLLSHIEGKTSINYKYRVTAKEINVRLQADKTFAKLSNEIERYGLAYSDLLVNQFYCLENIDKSLFMALSVFFFMGHAKITG